MPSAIIVGSGVAAAGAALALSRRTDLDITVLDIGARLEDANATAVARLSVGRPETWTSSDVDLITTQPAASRTSGLPEKRVYGSDYPFRDVGQLQGFIPDRDVHDAVVSAAYGGFSNVWGAQFMPFSATSFRTWPFSYSDLEPHYRDVLAHVPLAAECDDLGERFPLLQTVAPLPPVSDRTARVLGAYARHRDRINLLGISLGKARLAFRADECIRCGMCMTGCPYGLIYAASQTFDQLRRQRRVTYRDGLMALTVEEDNQVATVTAKDLDGGRIHRFSADKVYLACGTFATTRIVMNSLRMYDTDVSMGESIQFVMPTLSMRATVDPRDEAQFTLNQFNMIIELDEDERNLSQLHFYTYNKAFVDAYPAMLRRGLAAPLVTQLLRRTSVALGYIPSWGAPRLHMTMNSTPQGEVPTCNVRRDPVGWRSNPMLKSAIGRVVRASRFLDLYPVLTSLTLAAGGKSYHCGGSFPHRPDMRESIRTSDMLGRVGPWKNIHLVDGSVFPDVPATTFGFTTMANAHRIASVTAGLS